MRYVVLTLGLVCLSMTTGCLARESVASVPSSPPACPQVLVQRSAPSHCVQIQGEDVGRLPLELRVGDHAIHFAEWTQVDEASADVVGFAVRVPSDVVYAVKAGEAYYTGREPRWLHPAGVVGPKVHRIEAVTFCRVLSTRCGGTPIVVDTAGAASASEVGVIARR